MPPPVWKQPRFWIYGGIGVVGVALCAGDPHAYYAGAFWAAFSLSGLALCRGFAPAVARNLTLGAIALLFASIAFTFGPSNFVGGQRLWMYALYAVLFVLLVAQLLRILKASRS